MDEDKLLETCDILGDCINEIVQTSKSTTLNYFSITRILEKYHIDHIYK